MAIRHLEKLKGEDYFTRSGLPCIVREMRAAPSNEIIPMHDHEFSELVIVASGHLNHIHASGTDRLVAGNFFVIHPGEKHGYANLAKGTVVFNILYHSAQPPVAISLGEFGMTAEFFPEEHTRCRARTLGRIPRRELPRVTCLVREIRREETSKRPLGAAICLSLFSALLLHLSRAANRVQTLSENPLQAETNFIEQNIGHKISLNEICAVSGKSVSTLSREFKRLTGFPPAAFIAHCRIQKARELLEKGDTSIAAIAGTLGYSSAAHFSSQFRLFCGMSPHKYRTTASQSTTARQR